MCAGIDVNGIGWHNKTQNWVVIEIAMGCEDIPFDLTDSVTTFSFVDNSEIERTMNECVHMSEVDVFAKREEFVTISVGFR